MFLGIGITVRITIMSQEKGIEQWKSHQLRHFDGMIHRRADLYHSQGSRFNKHDAQPRQMWEIPLKQT